MKKRAGKMQHGSRSHGARLSVMALLLMVGCSKPQDIPTSAETRRLPVPAVSSTKPTGDILLPSHKKPVFSECAVSQGTLTISTALEGPNFTNVVPKAAVLQLVFETADGRQVRMPKVAYSDYLKCNYKYISVGARKSAYLQTVEVPKDAVTARVAMTRWGQAGEIRATPIKVKFTKAAAKDEVK